MNDSSKNNGNIVIGEGVSLRGDLSVPGVASIEGSFEGDLSADSIVVGARGKVVGTVKVRQAEVQGETRQTLQVTGKLIVRSTGQVHGNALYGELEVERGGVLRGAIKPMRGAAATSAPVPVSPVGAGASEVAVDAAVSVPTN